MDLNLSKSSTGKIIRDNLDFLIPYVLFSALIIILLGVYGNSQLFLNINGFHSGFADIIFRYLTNLGDGVVAALFILVLLWISFREALTFFIITMLITILINILKDHIFPEMDRPVAFFGTSAVLHLVSGYDPPALSTFPSGHSATAFSVGLYLSFFIKNRLAKVLIFLLALGVGYSRMYLSAHFPLDVLIGAAIGVSTTLICFYFGRRFKSTWMDRKIKFRPGIFARQQPV